MTSIDGLVSNLDTTAIVNAIIQSERINVDHLIGRQAETTNQLTTYQSISALVVALQTSVRPLLSESTFITPSVSVSDDDILSVTSDGAVTSGTYSLTVNALASNHQVASQGFDDPASATLGTGNIQISIGEGSAHTIVLDSSNNTLTGLKNAINQAKAGVTASVISDGSSSNAYRLLLTANATGEANELSITTNLTGGIAPDFASSSFDTVENLGVTIGTSAITLGAGASYTGSQNKAYTFTVAGSGSQTVGTDTVTINWTDGTDSGTFDVSAADTEVALTGDGSDGLTLSFGAGTLAAGDQFQIQTFTPLLQEARDASVSLGSVSGGGSPIIVKSATNEISNLIEGLTISLKDTSASPVIITTVVDKDAIKSRITAMLNGYNEVMKAIDKQFTYNEESGEVGTLLGDQFLLSIQSGLRTQMTGVIEGLPQASRMLRSLGIQTAGNGLMTLVSSSTLFEMIDTDLNAVRNLFVDSGNSSNALISFVSATTDTAETETAYDVDITQAATRFVLQGQAFTNPSDTPITLSTANNKLKLTFDGIASDDIVLTAREYSSGTDLASEIQQKISADSALSGRGLAVEWVDLGSTGYLKFTSGSYGSSSTITFDTQSSSALASLGLSEGTTRIAGHDVEGTINGEDATGSGRFLTGNADNDTTAGMRLEVRATSAEVTAGVDATITFSRGFASRLSRTAESISRSTTGSIAGRTRGLQAQLDDFKSQIEDQEGRLEVRRISLFERFTELEVALNQFQTQSQFLDQQLAQLSSYTQSLTSRR
jgi:flagellar hook-associated protein 2